MPIVALLISVGVAAALWRAAGAFRTEWSAFHPRRGPVPLPELPLEGLRDAVLPSLDGTELKGWLVPSRNGAAVAFIHGSGGDRRQLLPEARLVASRGFGVLLIDMPGHGESPGVVRWSAEARAAIRGAVAFLARQAGARPGGIGAYGFSMGAHALAQAAPESPELAAIVLAAPPTDGDELTLVQHARWGPLTQWPAVWADRLAGFDAAPTPLSQLSRWAQPALIIWGGKDPFVPPDMPERLVRAGGGPREGWVAPQAGHGGYRDADAAGFDAAVLSFFERRLLP